MALPGLITSSALRKEAGNPSEHPDSPTFTDEGELQAIINRVVDEYTEQVKRAIEEEGGFAAVRDVAKQVTLNLEKDKFSPGLAGTDIEDAYFTIITNARHEDGRGMIADDRLDVHVARPIAGFEYYRYRLRGRMFEALPNQNKAVYTHLVPIKAGADTFLSGRIAEINDRIIKQARDLVSQRVKVDTILTTNNRIQ